MLSSSVVYLSFAILNTFKNKKGVTKILVYSSVVVMNVILFAMVITRFDQIITGSFKTAFATYLL